MDFLDKKNHNLLQRLRYLQLEQCCLHIDQQIGLWLQHQVNPQTRAQQNATEEHSSQEYAQRPQIRTAQAAQQPTNQHQTRQPPLEHTHLKSSTPTTLSPPPPPPQPPLPSEAAPAPTTPTKTTATTTTATTTTISPSPPQLTEETDSVAASASRPTPKEPHEPEKEQAQAQLHVQLPQPPSSSPLPPIETSQPLLSPPALPHPPLQLATTTTITTNTATTASASVAELEVASSTPAQFTHTPQQPSPTHPSPLLQQEEDLQPPTLSPQPIELTQLQQQYRLDDADDKAIGCFLSNIKHLESFDSDATESTSSNDSYDELECFSHEDIPPKRTANYYCSHTSPAADPNDLKRKSIWRWAHERSRLASRWTWLQAQVADLEFRIRGLNDATMHARAYKIPPLPQVLPEYSCSRTVPISKDFGRRRLIRSSQILSDSNKKLVKFSHVPCVCSSLPQTVAPCLSCNGRYNYLRQIEGENAPISERISLLDPCCHPVLSFPEDLTLGSQISYLLKRETINRKPAKGRPGRKKGSTAANLAAAAAAKLANGENLKGRKRKYYHHGMVGRPPGSRSGLKNQSQTMITSNKLRRKYQKHSKANNYDTNWAGSNNRAHSTRHKKRVRRTSSINESSVCSESSNHFRSNNSGNPNAQNVTRRRRSEQSAYDINNIVIPFSIAATTRVEVLEYKEIMTPSWRLWENGTCQNDSVEEETEDTSDEAYILRHTKGESEEKKRFSLKPPKNTVAQKIGQMFPSDINM